MSDARPQVTTYFGEPDEESAPLSLSLSLSLSGELGRWLQPSSLEVHDISLWSAPSCVRSMSTITLYISMQFTYPAFPQEA